MNNDLSLPPKLVLIVDDDFNSAKIIQLVLKRKGGYHAEIATTAGSGIAAAVSSQPDLILLDTMMPGMDGWESCRVLKEMPETMHIPIIIFSALSDHKERGISAGACDYIRKPVDFTMLLARIEKAIANHSSKADSLLTESPFIELPAELMTKPDTEDIKANQKPRIFISYRRADSADITGRIWDHLALHLHERLIYRDVNSIPIGVDFKQHLETHIASCHILLAIIGKTWNEQFHHETDLNRLHDPDDYVRFEIISAIQNGLHVVPVLVQNASMPPASELPEELKSLSFLNAAQVRPDPDFRADIRNLVQHIRIILNDDN